MTICNTIGSARIPAAENTETCDKVTNGIGELYTAKSYVLNQNRTGSGTDPFTF